MPEETIQVVSPPSIDTSSYLTSLIDYITTHYPAFIEGLGNAVGFLVGISIPISVLLFIGIIVSVERLKYIRKKEEEYLNPPAEVAYDEEGKKDETVIKKWRSILEQVESKNPNDWRHAVIEADIMLGDLLTKMGYQGEGIGEQLKRITKGDLKSIHEAWEAHKVRNEIAHAGSDYAFSQHDARRTIHMYKKVFEELYYI